MQQTEEKNIHKIKEFLLNSFFSVVLKEKFFDEKFLNNALRTLCAKKTFTKASILLSYLALNQYRKGKIKYHQTINFLNDAMELAKTPSDDISDNLFAKKINIFILGLIEYYEKSFQSADDSIKTSLYIKLNDEKLNDRINFEIENFEKTKILSNIQNTKNIPSFIHSEIKDDALLALLQIGKTLSIETDIDNLLIIIAKQIQQVLHADRCSVFIYDEEKDELWSKVALGLETKEIRFSANKGLAGHVLRNGKSINIKNAYENEYFNKEIDLITGYKTKNILCMPIRNLNHQIVGVFQVLNKFDGDFTSKDEELLLAIGSSAGIAIENANLFSKQKKLIEEEKMVFSSFIDSLCASIDTRDKITAGHSKRVTLYTNLICEKFNLSKEQKEIMKNASLLHDIGKIGIKDAVLQKEGKLTTKEYEHIKEHVKLTHNILSKVYTSKNFKDVAQIASSHHERFDGTGYFKGSKGENIPLGGRILAVSDVFDAITSKRHYRDKMQIKDALKIMVEGKNKHFDGKIVESFMEIPIDKILKVILNDPDYDFKNDENMLKSCNLAQIYDIVNKSEKAVSKKEEKLIKVFNKYYQS